MALSVALIAIATIPESTAHLYQMSLYIDQLAKDLKKTHRDQAPDRADLVADGSNDAIAGPVRWLRRDERREQAADGDHPQLLDFRDHDGGVMAILLAFIGKLAALVNTIPVAVTGGLSIYLFGVIGKQGIALIQSEKVNLFDPKNLAIGAVILVLGIGGNLGLANGLFPFRIPLSSLMAFRRSCLLPSSASCSTRSSSSFLLLSSASKSGRHWISRL